METESEFLTSPYGLALLAVWLSGSWLTIQIAGLSWIPYVYIMHWVPESIAIAALGAFLSGYTGHWKAVAGAGVILMAPIIALIQYGEGTNPAVFGAQLPPLYFMAAFAVFGTVWALGAWTERVQKS